MAAERTRLAPTPSGFLHLGNLYSFMLTLDLARSRSIPILLRIDDMDQQRTDPQYIHDIFESLDFMGIPWQEGPKNATDFNQHYSQRLRMPLYEQLLEKVVASGKVYACSCSRSQIRRQAPSGCQNNCKAKGIALDSNDVAWRVDSSGAGQLRMKIQDSSDVLALFPESMQDFIVRRRDGLPAYQLCSLADDLHFGVNLIVRGQDLYDSSLAQLYLAELAGEYGFMDVHFVHHPLLLSPEGVKLSKSAGDTSIRALRKKGFRPDDIRRLVLMANKAPLH